MNNFLGLMALALVAYCVFEGIARIVKAARGNKMSSAYQQRIEDLEADIDSLEQELEDTRKRVEVLEKIVTDEKYDLKKEFDGLA